MQTDAVYSINPDLRELVVEASLALARLDAVRLEELALSCRVLNRDIAGLSGDERAELQHQARNASGELGVFGRVLDATRANLDIMTRVQERRQGGLAYPAGRGTGWAPWMLSEKNDGNR